MQLEMKYYVDGEKMRQRNLVLIAMGLLILTQIQIVLADNYEDVLSHVQFRAIGCRITGPLEASPGIQLTYNLSMWLLEPYLWVEIKFYRLTVTLTETTSPYAGLLLFMDDLIYNQTVYPGWKQSFITTVSPDREGYIYLEIYAMMDIKGPYGDVVHQLDTTSFLGTTVRSQTYRDLESSFDDLQTDFDSLYSNYTSLQSDYNFLNGKYDDLLSEMNIIKNLMYVFTITTIILVATTVYLAIRRPRVKPELKTT